MGTALEPERGASGYIRSCWSASLQSLQAATVQYSGTVVQDSIKNFQDSGSVNLKFIHPYPTLQLQLSFQGVETLRFYVNTALDYRKPFERFWRVKQVQGQAYSWRWYFFHLLYRLGFLLLTSRHIGLRPVWKGVSEFFHCGIVSLCTFSS